MHRQNFEDWAKNHPHGIRLEKHEYVHGVDYMEEETQLMLEAWIASATIPAEIIRKLLNEQILKLGSMENPGKELLDAINEARAFLRTHDSEVQIINPDQPQYEAGLSKP